MKVSKVSKSGVEAWLHDMGFVPKEAQPIDSQISWQLDFQQPSASMSVASLARLPRAVVVLGAVAISPDHAATFGDLDIDEKTSFMKELTTVLNREYTEYILIAPDPTAAQCPAGFQVSATRYDDGLTLDSFARTVGSVYKAQLAGIQCVRTHLASRGSPGSGSFDFRRMGGGIQ